MSSAKKIQSESFPHVYQHQGKGNALKTISERIKHRMRKDRQHVTVSFSVPDDVIEDLQEIAPTLGCTNYIALMRAYIG